MRFSSKFFYNLGTFWQTFLCHWQLGGAVIELTRVSYWFVSFEKDNIMKHKVFRSIIALMLVIGLVALQAPMSASAAGPWYVATTGSDGNDCLSPSTPCATINGAIGKATAGDTVYVASGTYNGASSNVVTIDKDVTLSGGWDTTFTAKSGMSTINGESTRRGMLLYGGITVSIDHFVIENSRGGIYNNANLTVENSLIQNNSVIYPGLGTSGGGIYQATGILMLHDTIISNNSANSGAGIFKIGGTLITNNMTISYNTGGGILITGGTTILNNSTINNNSNSTGGGGLYTNGGNTTINNTTVSNNNAALGGGLYNRGGNLNLNNVTVSNNTATRGGGIYSIVGFGNTNIRNSILANNTATISGIDCYISLTSSGYNVVGSTSGCTIPAASGDQFNVNPILGPLQDNGGSTFTHSLLPGSPAIDAGDNATCEATDQRGVARPQGATCDIGAFEVENPALDVFDRENGPIGGNWTGNTPQYRILDDQLQVWTDGSNSDIYWNEVFGPDQEAYVTLSQINGSATEMNLLLKSQSNTTWGDGVLEVLYNPGSQVVQVWTWEWPQGWVQHGADISISFVDGDVFSARALSDGMVEIYRNSTLVGTRDVSSWSLYDQGGYIGLWFIGAQGTRLDDFGGGTLP